MVSSAQLLGDGYFSKGVGLHIQNGQKDQTNFVEFLELFSCVILGSL